MARDIVITGIGVLSPVGIGLEPFWEALREGRSGIETASFYDASLHRSQLAAEVKDFNPQRLLERKGLQYLNRGMSLACAAAKLAMDDAQVSVTDENRARIGVVYGTTLSGLHTSAKFDQQALVEGPRYVNPMVFPTAGLSAPGCQISIMFGMDAFNSTLTNGFTSGLDAVNYAVNFIRLGRAEMVLAGGGEDLCREQFLAYSLSDALAQSSDEHPEICAPFDRRRSGIVLGEGSAVLLLEDYEHAQQRGAKIYARVRGYGSSFDPLTDNGYDAEARGATAAMTTALRDAELHASEVGIVYASADSGRSADAMEAKTLGRVFGEERQPPLTAIKSMLGESSGAGSALQVAAAALTLSRGVIPPTINYAEPDPECPVTTLVTEPREAKVNSALINSFGWNGNNASLVLTN